MAASPKAYRDFAQDCLRGAAETKSERHRQILLEMAKTWMQAALEVERSLGLTDGLPMPTRMDATLRFWVAVAYDELKSDHDNLTKQQLLAQILRQYERRGDAMRCLDNQGNIAWKASPRFLRMLADAERDAQDELEDFP
jgi:hypothetical protein